MRPPLIALKLYKGRENEGTETQLDKLSEAIFGVDMQLHCIKAQKSWIFTFRQDELILNYKAYVANKDHDLHANTGGILIGVEAAEFGCGAINEAQIVSTTQGEKRLSMMVRPSDKCTSRNNHAMFWTGEAKGKDSESIAHPVGIVNVRIVDGGYALQVREVEMVKDVDFSTDSISIQIEAEDVLIKEERSTMGLTNAVASACPRYAEPLKCALRKLRGLSPRPMYYIQY